MSAIADLAFYNFIKEFFSIVKLTNSHFLKYRFSHLRIII